MQRTAVGILFGAGLVMLASWAFSAPDSVPARHPLARPSAATDMIAFSRQLADGREQLTLIDTRSRVVGIYHVDPANGELALRSVRNINWDLRMTQFNGVSPLPQEIRSMLEQN